MWVRLAEWMIADGEPPLPDVGLVMPRVGVRLLGAIATADTAEVEGIVGVGEVTAGERVYRITGRVESPRDFFIDEGRGSGHAGLEFVIVVGSHRLHVQADGCTADVTDGSRITVTGRLAVIGQYEWEAFDLSECRADWRVESVLADETGDALLDLVPVTTNRE